VRNKRDGITEGIKPSEVKEKLDKKEDFVLLDVRSKGEHEVTRLEAPQIKLIPQHDLYHVMDHIPKDEEIVVMCRRGARAYQAACTLKNEGCKNVKFMEGSLTCWCDEVCGKPIW